MTSARAMQPVGLLLAAAALVAGPTTTARAAEPAADTAPERVQLQPRIERHPDGARELVIDARIAPGWILYASDFEQPQIGPRSARITLEDGTNAGGPLQSISAREGHGRSFAGDYRYTYFSEHGQLRLLVGSGEGPVTATLRAQVCFEENGLCELLQQEVVAR